MIYCGRLDVKELSLNILDIAMNSVKAGAKLIGIHLCETETVLEIDITDDGCGMSEETVAKLSDPFFTTRTTRKVGMGVPFYILAAQQTGGDVTIDSIQEPDPRHGTVVKAVFHKDSIDFTPLGDIVSTIVTLIQGYPDIDFEFTHQVDGKEVRLYTKEVREQIGDIPINSLEILSWIQEYISEQYDSNNP